MTLRQVLVCDMTHECRAEVTHIDNKGWAYCTEHGNARKDTHPCRKLTANEKRTLEAGGCISYDKRMNTKAGQRLRELEAFYAREGLMLPERMIEMQMLQHRLRG